MSAINIFDLPQPLPNQEVIDDLVTAEGVRIERIVSSGQTTDTDEWYDQDRDEWVLLIQGVAVLEYENGGKLRLNAGDHLLIPAHRRHRVDFTSENPPCIWITVFGELK